MLRITKETNRVYPDTTGTVEIRDENLKRTIRVEKFNSNSTVVWNPWTTQKLPDDFDPAEHKQHGLRGIRQREAEQNFARARQNRGAESGFEQPAAVTMISVIEHQPAGAAIDLVTQVEEIFSPTGILSRAKNFEFRPQQQEMAVAVARALQNREHLAVEAGTGVGKSLAYLIPAILFAVARKEKGRRLHAHHQFAGAAHGKRSADARGRARRAAGAGEVQLHDAQGPRELSLHAPAAKGDAAIGQPVHVVRSRGIAAHLRVVEGNHRTAACRISTSSRTRKSGRRFVPSAGCARRKSAATRPISPRTTASVFSSARGTEFFRRTCWC